MNIWQNLPKPIFALAPMEDVTDTVFRRVIQSCAPPDIMFTEFTSVDGLDSKGADMVSQRLKFTEIEKPLIAQIWGTTTESYYKASQDMVKRGFDGIDINMGCPVPKVIKRGCCSALTNDHPKAQKIIEATREGAGDLPISVKTRIGFKTIETEDWIGFLLEQNLDALIIHGRTTKELSAVPNHWDEIAKAKKLRDTISPLTIIIGNGDIKSRGEGLEKIEEHGLDGVMIGRGVLENPWIFEKNSQFEIRDLNNRLSLFKSHISLFDQTWGDKKNFAILKKFIKMYISGFDGAAKLRNQLFECKNIEELSEYLKQLVEKGTV
ncbi:dihydrouridine synthase [candidate division WWE3 bacterium CG_4_10_14_0_2_um_filter_41_14]|uniref:tRNA-dihydrouridine synthase n=1 Tax=candidate division WWE3 bacterium CG_4_10_14_0_2_um_filter_41_14 TaxID=1975072 RepID=A0A2M7TKY8_UNCKA|nr:MAG: dihydrouridine synthase [candidate division WWE3 bacterium CG_4_10_14_0_2_um_filter_41_14]